MSFPQITADGDQVHATIGEDWLQGRTAYGGISAALALMAVKSSFTDLPSLRSAQIAFVGPLAGDVTMQPTLLRRGKNSAYIACDVLGESGIGLRAMFLFLASRPSAIAYHDIPAPSFALDEDAVVDIEKLPAGFLRNLDVTPIQTGVATMRGWRRMKARAAVDPEVELLAIADALAPAAMSLIKEWGPISTTTWQLNIIGDSPETRDGWWLLEAKALDAAEGSSTQMMTMWNRDGRAVATATQSVALFV